MITINGWDVYLKVKEIAAAGEQNQSISVDRLADEFKGTEKDIIREYLNALAILEFIEFTDPTKAEFRVRDH